MKYLHDDNFRGVTMKDLGYKEKTVINTLNRRMNFHRLVA
jgi:hypothetical protein